MDTPAHLEAVEADTVEVEFKGLTLSLPATADDWELDTLEAFETGRAIAALRSLLGAERFAAVRKAIEVEVGRKARVGDLNPLMEQIARTYGFEGAGE